MSTHSVKRRAPTDPEPRISGAIFRRRTALRGLLLFVAWGLAPPLHAQDNGRIAGRVADAGTGAPLSDVQVYLQGAGLGSISRANGSYVILNVPVGSYELRAERIGLTTVSRSITVTAGSVLEENFEMSASALGLDEIVVTGTAGAARRREVGNTIAQINVDQIPDRPTSVTDLLTGAATGIEVTIGGGEIGQGSRIQLRGQNSLEMRNQPIVYIDGIRMASEGFPTVGPPDRRGGRSANITASPLDQLNPNDIERIEVIKGSAATTLYGTEASAGVIQIFTKRGTTGAAVWTAETQQGTIWSRKFGVESAPYNFMDPFLRHGWAGIGDGGWGTAHNQQYSLSVRGGGQQLQYFVSGQYQDEVGLQPLDELDRWTLRGNFSFSPFSELQLSWNSSYTDTWQKNTPSANNAQGLTLNVFRQERNYFGTGDPEVIKAVLVQDMQNTIERFTTGGTITYAPAPNITNRLNIGYDFSQQVQRHLRPFGFVMYPQGALHVHNYQKRLLTFDYVGTVTFELPLGMRSSFSWGGQAIGDEEHQLEAFGEDFPGAVSPTINSAALNMGFEQRQQVWNAGFFFQNVLDIQDRYFLTLGARVDGNSAFGEDFGLQFYPKASASWVISDESFWRPALAEAMKLRVAYGQSGRAPGAFDAVRTWDPLAWGGAPAFVPENVGNPDLGPEVTSEFETGFEGAWLSNRLRADFTYYRQITKDALLDLPQVPSEGFTQDQLVNLGKVKNSGFEVALGASPVQTPNWGLDLNTNFSTSENEILDLGEREPTNTLQVGYPLRPLVTWRVANPDQPTNSISEVEYEANHFYGPTHPTRIVSGGATLRIPFGVTLSALGEYRGGHYMNQEVFSIGRSVRAPTCYPYYVDPTSSIELADGIPALWRSRCTPSRSRGWVWDSDYFKLRSVSATIPMDFAFPERVNGATLTLVLSNSYLWMREMPFMDPEMLGNDGINSDAAGFSERIPAPISLRASLRITF